MRQIRKRLTGLALAGLWTALASAYGANDDALPGAGPAYELMGKVAVMHEGRIKPLDTVTLLSIVMVTALAVVVLSALTEIVYAFLDPRVRLQ